MAKYRVRPVAVILCILGMTTFEGTVLTGPAVARTPRVGFTSYIAMGDSYSSGEGQFPGTQGPYDPGTDSPSDRCHRHEDAWPRTLTNVSGTPIHLACSGAVIKNITTTSKYADEPAQIQRLRTVHPNPSLITLTIGGNDLGFGDVVSDCVYPDATMGHQPCLQSQRQALSLARLAMPTLLRNVYEQIHAAAPNSRLLVVGYPNIVGTRWNRRTQRNCPWLSQDELNGFLQITNQLERTIAAAAQAAGVDHVSTLNTMKGHEMCADRGKEWINPPGVAVSYPTEYVAHPNRSGQLAIAEVVDKWLAKNSARVRPPGSPAPTPTLSPTPEPTQEPTPEPTPDPVRWSEVSSGAAHVCGLDVADRLYCWGDGRKGNLGLGSSMTGDVNTPALVEPAGWGSVSSGADHTCGLRTDQSLWCWGANDVGQLGLGIAALGEQVDQPKRVGTDVWRAVTAANGYTCGLKSDRSLWCWGSNRSGQLGNGSQIDRAAPVRIGTDTWTSVAGQYDQTCGLRLDGSLWCWGGFPHDTQGGYITAPRLVDAGRWKSVGTSKFDTCAVRADDTLWCWGELIFDDPSDPVHATQVTSEAWTSVSVGYFHVCGIKASGSLWCWGDNGQGVLGDGTRSNRRTPAEVSGGGEWLTASADDTKTCGVKQDRSLWCWGLLGTDSNRYGLVPVKIET